MCLGPLSLHTIVVQKENMDRCHSSGSNLLQLVVLDLICWAGGEVIKRSALWRLSRNNEMRGFNYNIEHISLSLGWGSKWSVLQPFVVEG